MGFVYDALKKADQEGKIDKAWISQAIEKPFMAPPVLQLPKEVVKDFMMLKHNIHRAQDEQGTQILTITSSVSGEGCSTIIYFLGIMLSHSQNGFLNAKNQKIGTNSNINKANREKKSGVLLIDGNPEKSILHQLFGINKGCGLSEYILTAKSNNISIRKVSGNNLSLITSGMNNGNWLDIWNSEKMKGLIDNLRNRFKYILIDAPPILGNSETLALSKLTDGVLLVVKAGETRFEIIEEAKQQLHNAGVKVLGVVLNERKFYIPERIYRRI